MKRLLAILIVCITVFSLTACGAQHQAENAGPTESGSSEASASLPSQVQFETEHNGQTLKIDADISVPQEVPTEKIVLVYDEDAEKALYDALIDDPSLIDYEDSEGKFAGISFDSNRPEFSLGYMRYGDHRKTDMHEKGVDPDADFFRPYMTSIKPGNMQKSGEEAAQELISFLENYSCLQYFPLSVTATEGADGAYSMHLLPAFEGAHILGRDMYMGTAQVRESGLEEFMGSLLLKEAERLPLENPLSFQEILERFQSDYHQYTFEKNIHIRSIEACYVAVPNKDSWALHPSWAFLGTTSGGFIEPYSDYHSSSYSVIGYIYDMETGFLDVLDGNSLMEYF